jgi:hypothetical protein
MKMILTWLNGFYRGPSAQHTLQQPINSITGEVSLGFQRKRSEVLKSNGRPVGLEPQTSTVSKAN